MRTSSFLIGATLMMLGIASGCTLDPSGTNPFKGGTAGPGGGDASSTSAAGGSAGAGGMGGSGGEMAVCGDGIVGGTEECDDANAVDKDGCTTSCTYDLYDDCPPAAIPVGTTPRTFEGNTTMANNTSGVNNCGGTMSGDYIVAITPTVDGTLTIGLKGDYDTVVWLMDQCPSGQVLGCQRNNPAEIKYEVTAGGTYYVGVDGFNGSEGMFTLTLTVVPPVCGDGMVTGGEVCDDGVNNGMYGYCKSDCTGKGPFCGDAIMNGPEQCDDGNTNNNDACPNTCLLATCGDNIVQFGVEQCDDGNLTSGDGCSGTCSYEPILNGCPVAGMALGSTPFTFMGDTTSADNTSASNCNATGPDILFRIVPTMSGTLTATLNPTFNNSALWIRTSCLSGTINCVVGNQPLGLNTQVTMGQSYYLAVDGTSGNQGPFTLTLVVQ